MPYPLGHGAFCLFLGQALWCLSHAGKLLDEIHLALLSGMVLRLISLGYCQLLKLMLQLTSLGCLV